MKEHEAKMHKEHNYKYRDEREKKLAQLLKPEKAQTETEQNKLKLMKES